MSETKTKPTAPQEQADAKANEAVNASDNMAIWNKGHAVPEQYRKSIEGGRNKGLSAINPMWRIETLTSIFGPIGVGWKYATRFEETTYPALGNNGAIIEGERLLTVYMDFQFRTPEGDWSDPFEVVGTAKTRTLERNGWRVDDDAPKKAVTDALGQACKMLGIGADVYYSGVDSPEKYTNGPWQTPQGQSPQGQPPQYRPQAAPAPLPNMNAQIQPMPQYQPAAR